MARTWTIPAAALCLWLSGGGIVLGCIDTERAVVEIARLLVGG